MSCLDNLDKYIKNDFGIMSSTEINNIIVYVSLIINSKIRTLEIEHNIAIKLNPLPKISLTENNMQSRLQIIKKYINIYKNVKETLNEITKTTKTIKNIKSLMKYKEYG